MLGWFITYVVRSKNRQDPNVYTNAYIRKHPFEWLQEARESDSNVLITLLNWHQVDDEDEEKVIGRIPNLADH